MVQNGTEKTTSPTRRQRDDLPYLVASTTLSDGSRLADIGRTILYHWLYEPDLVQQVGPNTEPTFSNVV